MYDAAMPSVTILINTYNYARFIGRAIESALQQDYTGPRPEILVVDDGSTDDTAAVARRYAPRVLYIAKENGGHTKHAANPDWAKTRHSAYRRRE